MSKSTKVFISSVLGNSQLLDGGAMFGNAPRPLWEKWLAPDAIGRIAMSCRAMLIELGPHKILCETGIGVYMEPNLATRYGVMEREHRLLENLAQLGLSDADIDYVILSHLHFDHAGGLLPSFESGSSELLFPNARYVIGKEAWERALHPHPRDRASFIPGLCERLLASGRLILIEGDSLPGIDREHLRFRYSWGHTPGHMHTLVRGEKEGMIFAGDLVPGQAWVHLPITMGYDRFPEKVIDEKEELYNLAAKEDWQFFFTHDPMFACARIAADEKGRFTPVAARKELRHFELA